MRQNCFSDVLFSLITLLQSDVNEMVIVCTGNENGLVVCKYGFGKCFLTEIWLERFEEFRLLSLNLVSVTGFTNG